MTDAQYLNAVRWSEAIFNRQKQYHDQDQQFQAQVLKELARMSAELDALTATVNKLAADVQAVVNAYKTAKANEADPAVLTQLNTTLSGAATSIETALNPPAA